MSEATLSDRGRAMAQTSLKARLQPLLCNLYHPKDNPNGIVDMGTAENHVMTKDVSSFANTKIRTSPHDFTYGEGPWGSERLRTAMANHMNKYFQPFSAIYPNDLVFANDITSLCELFGYAIGSPNDGILISRPSYQAFPADFGARAGLKCVFVSFGNVDQFSPAAIENYESTLLEARDQGISIKALLLCNPHNPLGRCYPLAVIKALMQLCNKHSLHLFADEVYALSVFSSSSPSETPFSSVLSFDSSSYISPDYLHVVYGMSKDFAAGGLRLGCLYSRNTAVLEAVSAVSQFSWSGPLNQLFAAEMLEDEEWKSGFLERSRDALKERYENCTGVLNEYGIEYSPGSNAGFFLWVNFRPVLDMTDHKDEWAAEDALVANMEDNGVYITKGSLLQAEQAGWFRIVFTQEDDVMQEGFKRLFHAIGAKKVEV
ncbi:PLP-dependent transferase, partial [Aureobasidium melanogenum]|uniref:PLP-dependent transferase n=1 Tax=Aureobasidium melanogenum (strain CBS 110374) TaxID=1043003 RepID=A0A074VH39_AURM1